MLIVPFLALKPSAWQRPLLLASLAGLSIILVIPTLYPHLSMSSPTPGLALSCRRSRAGSPYQPGPFAGGSEWGPGLIVGGLFLAAVASAKRQWAKRFRGVLSRPRPRQRRPSRRPRAHQRGVSRPVASMPCGSLE